MPPAPTTSNFAFCTIAKRSWKFMTHEAPGDPDESCVFFLFRLLFFGGGKGVNCEPIHDYNYGYSFNFLLPVCKQDWTNKTTTPPKRIYLTKNQHLHQHISTLLSTILTIEYHFQFGETYLQNKECICKKTSKNPLFFAKRFQQVHGFNPPARPGGNPPTTGTDGTSPKTAFTAASPAAATALGPVMTSGHQPVGPVPSLGGKNPFSEWLCSLTFFILRRWIF